MSGATWDLALARHLVGSAARRAPPGLAPRLEEEWLADLMSRQGAFARIRFALGCCWATRVIARDFAAAAAAGSSASGQRLLVAHAGFDFSRVSRRTIALIVIVCLHVGILYLYLTGFTRTVVINPASPLTSTFLNEPHRQQPPTRLLPPTMTHTIVDTVPPPDLPFKLPADPKVITVARANVPPAPPQPRVNRVVGGPGAGFPDTEDYYPAEARRLGEAGATVVSVCVDPHGRLTAAPAVVTSSGVGQIDEGALRLARAGSGHYRPTTENGQPVSSCYPFRVRFQLEDE